MNGIETFIKRKFDLVVNSIRKWDKIIVTRFLRPRTKKCNSRSGDNITMNDLLKTTHLNTVQELSKSTYKGHQRIKWDDYRNYH